MYYKCVVCDKIWCDNKKCQYFKDKPDWMCKQSCGKAFYDANFFWNRLIEFKVCLECQKKVDEINRRQIEGLFNPPRLTGGSR